MKKSFQTFQTFQSTHTVFLKLWENRRVSMDHRDMRVGLLRQSSCFGYEGWTAGLWCQLGGEIALARARSARPDGTPAALRRAAPSGLALYKSTFLRNEPN
jgi:hypothetical protein